MFIHDIYHGHDIVRAGVPAEQVFLNAQYRPEMQDVDVAEDIYCHIAGVDIVRAARATTCWKTTCACPRACPTCWRTARCRCG